MSRNPLEVSDGEIHFTPRFPEMWPSFCPAPLPTSTGPGVSAVIAAATYFACYRRHSQMVQESPLGRTAWRFGIGTLVTRLLARFVLGEGSERAMFYFVLKTLARSAKHRLYFVAYLSVGLGIVLVGLLEMTVHSTHGNLWAAFSRPSEALLSVPLVVSFFSLSGMRIVFGFPAELKANWIFQIADEGDGGNCLAGVRKAMIAVAVAPAFAVIFVVYAVLWGVFTSLLTVLFGILMSLILIEILLYSFRKIPFTCSYLPGKTNLPAMGALCWVAFAIYAYSAASLEKWMLHEPVAWIVGVGVEFAILARIVAIRNRLFANGFNFQYEDDQPPAVQSLHLDDT